MSSIWYDFYLCEKQRADYAKNQETAQCFLLLSTGIPTPLPAPIAISFVGTVQSNHRNYIN